MRKPRFCICENKDADQLRGNREADQHLCFRYIESTISLLSKSEISILYLSSVAVQPGLCRTRSETRMLVFSRRGSNFQFGLCQFLVIAYFLHIGNISRPVDSQHGELILLKLFANDTFIIIYFEQFIDCLSG